MNMTSTEEILNIRQSALGSRLEREAKREGIAGQGSPAPARSLAAGIQSVKQELDAVRREQAKLQQAIYEAAQVQRRLCAPRELIWGEFEIAGEIFPVRHLSGDFFKVMELDSVLGLTVGDIAGKGLSAGIWQAHLMGLVQRCARKHSDPAAAVAEVNRELCQDNGEPPLTALFFARLDPERSELVYCSAGLPAPLLLRHKKSVERLEKGGPMLGAVPEAAYESGSVRLDPGDMVLAYSDGVTECRNSQGEEFEMERLSTAANAVSGASANQALFSTLGAVLDFADACSPEDDLTLLVIRRREGTMTDQPLSGSKFFSEPRSGRTSVAQLKKAKRRGNRSK
jgi:serine phosphatase RsbU (regulator of sigma subunit)